MHDKPLIAISIGDPAGVGPEVCAKAMATGEPQMDARIIFVGSVNVLRRAAAVCSCDLRFTAVDAVHGAGALDDGTIAVLDRGELGDDGYRPGTLTADGGHASMLWVRDAIALAERGDAQAMIMAPVDRRAFTLAGITGALPELQPPDTFQFRMSGALRVVPVTEHLPLRAVAAQITAAAVENVITVLDAHARRWGMAHPRIGVAGLNPPAAHEEDREQIAPAVAAARARGIDVEGPIAPDAVFRLALEGRYDAVVGMYHDQGQIAVKTAAFAGACTVFLGLPYVRVGVPHGTAIDIAGTGRAQHLTMLSAMRTAASLAAGRGFPAPP